MKLKQTDHSYYCHNANYFRHGVLEEYDDWDSFKIDWEILDDIDMDFNFVFRFDIRKYAEDDEEKRKGYYLCLYYMQQRKGKFVPVIVHNIKQKNMKDIQEYLSDCWIYMKDQWKEFSMS